MNRQTTTATTPSNIADAHGSRSDEPALEALTDADLASVVGGDNPSHGNYGGNVQCVYSVSADRDVCSVY